MVAASQKSVHFDPWGYKMVAELVRLFEDAKLADVAHNMTVTADWDAEAGVWVAMSEDVPGLVLEAASMDDLVPEIELIIPQLMRANGVWPSNGEQTLDYAVVARIERSLQVAAVG